MKRTMLLSLLVLITLTSWAQVANYCLRMMPGAQVSCGAMTEMNDMDAYTVQFWFNAAQWTVGTSLLVVDNAIDVKLQQQGKLSVRLGKRKIPVAFSALKAGRWAQVTIVVGHGLCKILVNGNKVLSYPGDYKLPPKCGELKIGGDFEGRIDEVRLWGAALDDHHNYYIYNTLNKWMPEADNLLVYYKFDQNLCRDIVDYTMLFRQEVAYNHHAHMPNGAYREVVTDNPKFKYRLCGAYLNNNRLFDRGVSQEQYLLANDIIMLSISSSNDGHLRYDSSNDHAKLNNCRWIEDFEGRKGVVELDGNSSIVTTKEVLCPKPDKEGKGVFAFETWLYLDEWTEGAYIVRKETEDGKHGFSIALGKEEKKEVVVKVDGKIIAHMASLRMKEWVHFAVSVNGGDEPQHAFLICYNGVGQFADINRSDHSTVYTPTQFEHCVTVIGQGLKAKLDNTVAWGIRFSAERFAAHAKQLPMPQLGKVQPAEVISAGQCCYEYDREHNAGFDSYSQDHWNELVRSAFKGYRGYQVRVSVKSHPGWQKTIADAHKRKIFAEDLARLSEPYDGVELDLEWLDGKQDNLGLLADEIRAKLPRGKQFMISCHAYGAYKFPHEKMNKVDGFTFQQYGPQKTFFTYDNFVSSAGRFINYGFEMRKIYLSYSTTTSRAHDTSGRVVAPITGYRTLMQDGTLNPNDEALGGKAQYNGNYYYYMSPQQVYKRAKYVVDNNLLGLFYWDMGNDIDPHNALSLARNASYALNSNVDKVVTSVQVRHANGVDLLQGNSSCTMVYDSDNQVVRVIGGSAWISAYTTAGVSVKYVSGSELSLRDLPRGIYLVTLRTPNATKTIKVLK